jgi:hypothetical protein
MTGMCRTGCVTRKITVLLVMVGLLVMGCSENTPGTPNAADTTTADVEPTTTSNRTSPRQTSSQGADDSLADVEPCSLMSDEDKTRLGLRNEEDREIGGARLCKWVAGTSSSTYSVGVGIRDSQGLAEVVGADGTPKPISVGGREAREARDTSGETCLVAIGVSDSSRVDIQAIGPDMAQMCETAHEFAELVEPKLPRE